MGGRGLRASAGFRGLAAAACFAACSQQVFRSHAESQSPASHAQPRAPIALRRRPAPGKDPICWSPGAAAAARSASGCARDGRRPPLRPRPARLEQCHLDCEKEVLARHRPVAFVVHPPSPRTGTLRAQAGQGRRGLTGGEPMMLDGSLTGQGGPKLPGIGHGVLPGHSCDAFGSGPALRLPLADAPGKFRCDPCRLPVHA